MKQWVIDLYAHFSLNRDGRCGGYLTVMAANDPMSDPDRKRPAILIVPGGGYEHVSPREGEPVALRFLARGFNAFILNYSVGVRYPVHLQECALAMAYLRLNQKGLDIDGNMVCIIGFSAGGHLAANLSFLPDCAPVKDILSRAGIGQNHISLRPDAQILCYPVITSTPQKCHAGSFKNLTGGDEALTNSLSLEKAVTKDSPPTFIWHTADDGSVPVHSSLYLGQALADHGVSFALRIYPHGNHGLSVADKTVLLEEPDCSKALPAWPEEAISWLEEMGIYMR